MKNAKQWYSIPFFAFHEGYQVCLKVYTTGYGKDGDNHISVFIHLMKGPHDDKLQQSGHWPLRGTFIIKLFNQYNGHHYSKKIKFSDERVVKGDIKVGWGLLQFLSHHDITDYLKDDCLNFEISYKDTATDSLDPSSDQTTQGYFKHLLLGILHAIAYMLKVIYGLITLIVKYFILTVAFILGCILGLIVVILYVVYYVAVGIIKVAYYIIVHIVFMQVIALFQ